MPALFDLLEREEHASVRAVLGPWMLGYIHPFPDGTGRVARFLMNAMQASAGSRGPRSHGNGSNRLQDGQKRTFCPILSTD